MRKSNDEHLYQGKYKFYKETPMTKFIGLVYMTERVNS